MAQPVYQFELYDRANGSLADISGIAFEAKGSYRLNRPAQWTFRVPVDSPLVNTVHTDGFPYLATKRRCLKVRRTDSDGSTVRCIFNGLVWSVERSGDENTASALVTCVDPMIWWTRRPVRDDTGNFSKPHFDSPIAGGDIIKQAVNNSITYEGKLGIDTAAGAFDVSIPPAIDLSVALTDWPIMLSDFAALLVNTGAVDVAIQPVDDADGYDPDVMGVLSAVNQLGTDLSATVHFDYATGDFNVSEIRVTETMEELCNKLYMYFGPKINDTHWKGLVTASDPALLDPPQTALAASIAASRTDIGVWMDVQIYDDDGVQGDGSGTDPGTASPARPLFEKLWQTESLLRVEGRTLLGITPKPAADWLPFEFYNLGDLIVANADAAAIGIEYSGATQRIYGFDVAVGDDGVERVGELIASADQE